MALKLDLSDLDEIAAIHAPHLIGPPGIAPSAPQIAGPGLAPETLPVGAPPAQIQKPTRQESNAAGRSEFRAGKPTITAEPGTAGYFGQRIAAEDYANAHPWGSPVSEHPGFLGKVGHAFAKAGNIAGDVLAPAVMENIPGTDLNKQLVHSNTLGKLAQAKQEDVSQEKADTEKEGVEQRPDIAEAAGESKGRLEAQREADADKRSQATLDSQETRAEAARKEQEAGRTHSDEMLDKRLSESEKLQADRERNSDARLNKTLSAQHDKKSAAESAQVERESRGAIRKASENYRDASEKAASMNDFINAAKGGNKAAYANVPLEGALDITTSQGTKRINRTEVKQYAGAGSLFDKISGAVGKLTKGASIPNNVLDDMNTLSQILEGNAYKKYSDTYDDEAGIVHGYGGTDFDKRVPKIQRGGADAAADTTGGIQVIRDANGRIVGVK